MAKKRCDTELERVQSGGCYKIKQCSRCFRDSVHYFCTHCQDDLCENCWPGHLSSQAKTAKWHNVVRYRDKNRGIVQRRTCGYHDDFTSTAYCYTCDRSICEQCTGHEGHETISISQLLKERVNSLLENRAYLSQNVKPAIEKLCNAYSNDLRMLNWMKIKVRQDIFQYIQRMLDTVNMLRDKLLSDLNDETRKWENEIRRFMSKTQRKLAKVIKRMKKTDEILTDIDTMHNPELLPMNEPDESKYHQEESNIEVPHIHLFSAEVDLEFLENNCAKIAKGNAKSFVEESEIDELNCKELEFKIKDMSYNAEQNKICITQKGKKAVCEINHAGKITREFTATCIPRCATICKKGVIYGNSPNKTVEIIQFNFPEEAKVIMSTEEWFPRGISVSPSEEILVCLHSYGVKSTESHDVKSKESHGKVVVIRNYDSELEKKVDTIEYDDSNEVLFQGPRYVVKNKNDICVSDCGSLVVVDSLGKLKFKYKKGYSNFPLNPQNVCVDSNCHILLLDLSEIAAIIHVINGEGHFVQYLIASGLQKPTAMTVDSEDQLFVADGHNGKIKTWPLRY